MEPPPGIGLDAKILRLAEALYSLKQAQVGWFEPLSEALAEMYFISLRFNPCVFISVGLKIIVVVYVDDITTARSRSHMNLLIDPVCSLFRVTVKGRHKFIRGIEI